MVWRIRTRAIFTDEVETWTQSTPPTHVLRLPLQPKSQPWIPTTPLNDPSDSRTLQWMRRRDASVTAWKPTGDRLLQRCYLSRDEHTCNRKIRTRKQRTDIGKYSLVNRTIRSWNQLAAGLPASFPCKLNTFRKRVKNVVTGKGITVGTECK